MEHIFALWYFKQFVSFNFIKGFHIKNAKWVSKFNSLLFPESNFTLNIGTMEDLPFRAPTWHSKMNRSACDLHFSFKIALYSLYDALSRLIPP